ncbi:MAG: protein-L-isoaspartate(D-aspartate) O-methyltransferase [Candidatus Zixiibacteriota bacterium]|nr:MAG: protein-L-isoaspartate(D-aspartate) O-methyltransferase [candidate division Zixibacteria bacterium]
MSKLTGNSEEVFAERRHRMIERQIVSRGVQDRCVLDAMRTVPRHRFVPSGSIEQAYQDGPLSIGQGQTISQPYIVASMTEHLELTPSSRVLEIGTGCGYQTAVLAEIAAEVVSLEIIEKLHARASELLTGLRYHNIILKHADGSLGWPDLAPYDGIIVTATAPQEPQPLLDQLSDGGRLVIPIGSHHDISQKLWVITRDGQDFSREYLYDVRFVPMTGEIDQ